MSSAYFQGPWVPAADRALVTGGSSGIGRDIALMLAGAGVEVFVVGRRMERLEAVAAESDGSITPLAADIRDADAVDAAFTAAEAEGGPVPLLVNAAGAWADTVAQLAGVDPLGLTPLRRSAAILPAPEGHDVTGWPAVCSMSETWYAKPEAGKLMVSPADEDPVEPHDAWADDMVLAEGLDRYGQAVTTPVTRVERSWAGLRTFAPDRTPVVGFDAVMDGFFWLAGQGGYGIQTAPALSRLAGALLRGEDGSAVLPANVVAALAPGRLRGAA